MNVIYQVNYLYFIHIVTMTESFDNIIISTKGWAIILLIQILCCDNIIL